MVKKHILHVGRIHADWCGHCISLNGEWKKLKNRIHHNIGRSLKNVSIEYHDFEDSDERKKQGHYIDKEMDNFNQTYLANSENTVALQGGFPTIFRVLDDKLEYYNGERDASSLYSWMTRGISGQNAGEKKTKRKITSKKRKSVKRSIKKTNLFRYFFR